MPIRDNPPSTEPVLEARGFDIRTPSIQSGVSEVDPKTRENVTLFYKPPKLGHFSCQEPPAKDEVPYEDWVYEVQSNRTVCVENVLHQGIIQFYPGMQVG